MRRRFALPPIVACASIATASAQELDYGAFEALFAEPVTTSVTGSPQRAGEVPATMEIVTAEDIRRSGAHDIPGVLRHVTGVHVLDWTNSASDVAIRGYNTVFSSRLLVLVNGRQVYADHYGYTPWSTLPVELGEIRQIEIVKGPNSALFGFNAVGGVINIITYGPEHDDVDFMSVRGGTQSFAQSSAAMTVPLGENGGIRLSGGVHRNDDFSTPLYASETIVRQGDERASLRFDAHFEVSPSTWVEIESSYTGADQTDMVPTYTLAYEQMAVGSLKAAVNSDTRFGLVQASVYRNRIDNEAYASTTLDGIEYFYTGIPIVVFDNNLTVAQARNIFKVGAAHTFRISGELRESSVNTTPYEGGIVTYDVVAGGFMWQWQISPSLELTNAIRKDRLELGRSGILPAALPLTNEDWERTIDVTSFNSGLVWRVTDNDVIRVTAARGAQLPNLFNLGSQLIEFPQPPPFQPPLVYITGLPTLRPTVVSNAELAWERALPELGMDLTVAVFSGETRNVISDSGTFDLSRAIFSAPSNVGDSKARGVELSAKGSFATNGRWRMGYIREEIEDRFDPLLYPTWLTYRNFEDTTPERIVNTSVGWTKGRWEADLHVLYQSKFQGLRGPETFDFTVIPDVLVDIPSHVSVDGRLAYQVRPNMTLSLSGRNLTRGEQRQTSGPLVERRVVASFDVEF